jgi:hypothetical protein
MSMLNKSRDSIFLDKEINEDIILSMSEEDMATLISVVVFAQKMYEVSANVMREQGKIAEAQKMEANSDKAIQIANSLAMSIDPDYPRAKSDVQ